MIFPLTFISGRLTTLKSTLTTVKTQYFGNVKKQMTTNKFKGYIVSNNKMPKKLSYDIVLTHIFTGEVTRYTARSIVEVVNIINRHYGLELVTNNSVNSLIRGKQKVSRHLRGITVLRRQTVTPSFPNGAGGQYPSVYDG